MVSDLLSYCGTNRATPHPLAFDEPDDETLTQRFHSSLPHLVPQHFAISSLPPEILSFTIHVLQTTELSYILSRKEHMRRETESGGDGAPSAENWVSPITHTSVTYPSSRANSSPDPSWQCTVPPTGTNREVLLATVKNSGIEHCPRCRKPSGCVVSGQSPTKPLSHPGERQAPSLYPIPLPGLRQRRPPSESTMGHNPETTTPNLPVRVHTGQH